MKPSEILTKAAENLDAGKHGACCDAIHDVNWHREHWDNIDFSSEIFESLFRLDKNELKHFNPYDALWFHPYWFGNHGRNKEHRVMALLMTAAMAESVGL